MLALRTLGLGENRADDVEFDLALPVPSTVELRPALPALSDGCQTMRGLAPPAPLDEIDNDRLRPLREAAAGRGLRVFLRPDDELVPSEGLARADPVPTAWRICDMPTLGLACAVGAASGLIPRLPTLSLERLQCHTAEWWLERIDEIGARQGTD